MDTLDTTQILKSVLNFFEKEKAEGARLSLDNPVKRLCLVTGLSYNQVYYYTHEGGCTRRGVSHNVVA